MLKKKFIVIIGLLILLIGCSEDTVTEYVNEQNVVCLIQEWESDESRDCDLNIWGQLSSTPLPEFNYFIIDSQMFNSTENYTIYPGYGIFELTNEEENALNINDDIDFEFDTEFGTVIGSQNRPNLINNIRINGELVDTNSSPEAQIALNEELLVSWEYDNERPDFIRISGLYWWYVGDEMDEILVNRIIPNTQNSVLLFEENELSHTNSVLLFDIIPSNGPNPENNTGGNLAGDGTGYLYWSYGKDEYNIDAEIDGGSRTQIDPTIKKEKLLKLKKSLLETFK